MDAQNYASLSLKELALIVKDRYGAAQYAVIQPELEGVWQRSKSLREVLSRLDEHLNKSMMSTRELDPAQQSMIDKRFKTLVRNELSKRFGDDIHLVSNLDEIVDSSKSLKEIQMRVQLAISNIKARS